MNANQIIKFLGLYIAISSASGMAISLFIVASVLAQDIGTNIIGVHIIKPFLDIIVGLILIKKSSCICRLIEKS